MAEIRVGVSGWTFEGWRGSFYPEALPRKDELKYMTHTLNSLEINGTFYALQKPETFREWYRAAPADFRFAIKAPRYMTHVRRLKEIERPLANFLASGLLALGEKLGPILWQFPPNVTLKDERFARFLKMLPHTLEDAAAIAKGHDTKVDGRSLTEVTHGHLPFRHAFEFRHKSFFNPEFLALLKQHGVALVIADAKVRELYAEDLTSDFAYMRLHGPEDFYPKGYPAKAMASWTQKVECWSQGTASPSPVTILKEAPDGRPRDVFCYFDNDVKEYAPLNAMDLMVRLGLTARQGSRPKQGKAG